MAVLGERPLSDVQRALITELLGTDGRLFIVSNRGPITFDDDPSAPDGIVAARGSGGLVTALAELGRYAPITWIACALTDADKRVAGALHAQRARQGRGLGPGRGRLCGLSVLRHRMSVCRKTGRCGRG